MRNTQYIDFLCVRLSGIDTPELRTKHENEKIARDALSQKILNKIVVLKNSERVLADKLCRK